MFMFDLLFTTRHGGLRRRATVKRLKKQRSSCLNKVRGDRGGQGLRLCGSKSDVCQCPELDLLLSFGTYIYIQEGGTGGYDCERSESTVCSSPSAVFGLLPHAM